MVSLRYDARTIMTGEATASQLPGRDFGPADAYRHIVLAAEWARAYGTEEAAAVLTDHELGTGGAADSGMDFWNNEIGIRIGEHVAAQGGGWKDVVVLAREAVVKSFAGLPYDQIPERWAVHEADDGLRRGYAYFYELTEAYAVNGYAPPPFQIASFDTFAADYNRSFRFRTAANGPILLDGGTLEVNPIATTSPQFWQKNPEVDGQDISIAESAYPDVAWASGIGFVYEEGNGSDAYYREQYGAPPPVGFGNQTPRPARPPRPGMRRRQERSDSSGSVAPRRHANLEPGVIPPVTGGDLEAGVLTTGQALLDANPLGAAGDVLTVPGSAMSVGQREALMALPAFSDEADPLFGAAVWKYRDANAGGAKRASAMGAVDIFGQPSGPVFAETEGAPADADGRPMNKALAGLGKRVDAAAAQAGSRNATAALQEAVNEVGDAQVTEQSAPDGRQANRIVPRIAIDGVIGPQTRQAVRLALHQEGADRLSDRFAKRLRRSRRAGAFT